MQALLLLSREFFSALPAASSAPGALVGGWRLGEDQRMTGQGVGAARRRSRGYGPLTRRERHTLTERGQGLGSQPLPPEDRTRPFGPLALGRGRGEWGRRQDNFSASLVTAKPRRRPLQGARLSPSVKSQATDHRIART